MVAAAEKDLPMFVPGWEDSTSGNVFAAQFHPEKSSKPGLRLLSNFVEVCRD